MYRINNLDINYILQKIHRVALFGCPPTSECHSNVGLQIFNKKVKSTDKVVLVGGSEKSITHSFLINKEGEIIFSTRKDDQFINGEYKNEKFLKDTRVVRIVPVTMFLKKIKTVNKVAKNSLFLSLCFN